MIGRRIFSARGSPITNMSFQMLCITELPPHRVLRMRAGIVLLAVHEILKLTRSRRLLVNPWMSLMPVSVQLEGSPCLNYRVIVTGSAYELQPGRKILVRESTRNGHCRKPADIADAAEGIGDRKSTRLNSSHSQISYA